MTVNDTPEPTDAQHGNVHWPIRPHLVSYTRWERARANTSTWSRTYLVPFLRRRGNDVEDAMSLGWSFTALWLRVLAVLAGLGLFAALFDWAGNQVLDVYYRLAGHTHTGLLATLSHPVRGYLHQHTAGLPISAQSAFGLWEMLAVALVILAFTGSTLARLAWLGYGAATAAMVWSGTADPARPVATAVAVLLWGVGSLFALRGLSLRPVVNVDARHQADRPTPVGLAKAAPADD